MKLRIGTRKSPLAMWQARHAQKVLEQNGYTTEIVPISSEGDLKLTQPIYELGVTGVFTKSLDIALLNNQIDVAVHSLKDVPTQLANGLQLAACLARGDHRDILVYKSHGIWEKEKRTIATGSLRRRAFWLNNYSKDEVVDLRGNVQLRIQKLLDNPWDGAIFAYAGLDRSDIISELKSKSLQFEFLNHMVSAPSQGIVGLVTRNDLNLNSASDSVTYKEALIERAFLRTLQGGCTAPIGAYAKIENNKVSFTGAILSLDGQQKIEIEEENTFENPIAFGEKMAQNCIKQGADKLIQQIKQDLKL